MAEGSKVLIPLSTKTSDKIKRQCLPQTWRRLVDWFEIGKIPYGDPKRPSRLFRPSEVKEHAHLAVVINGELRYQEPEEIKSYGPEIDKMLGL